MKTVFDVNSMTCAACQAHVEKAVSKLDGVQKVSVSLMLGRMDVTYDEHRIDAQRICREITAQGYPTKIHGQETAAAKESTGQEKQHAALYRLIATAALSVILFYIAMGPMLGLPQLPFFRGEENVMILALTQAVLATAAVSINFGVFKKGFVRLFRGPSM